MTIFGVPWSELRIEHVRRFLQSAGPEPLSWEAKGTELSRNELRVQVCGFANSHDGGYLILGATEANGRWVLDGLEFPADPPTWVTDVIGDHAVLPYPDGLDTKAFSVGDARHVAVVRIPPVATPPCNTGGRVYERVSGRTIPVRDPTRLANLFQQGDEARKRAEASSQRAAISAIQRGPSRPNFDAAHIQFGVGLTATAYDLDIGRRLFSLKFQLLVEETFASAIDDPLGRLRELPLGWETAQDRRRLEAGPTHNFGSAWSIETTWDGAVGLHWIQALTSTRIDSVVDNGVRPAWAAGEAILRGLAPRGPRYLTAIFAGAMFPNFLVSETPEAWLPVVSRGPLDPGVHDDILAGIARELNRAVGRMEYEPPDADGG